MLQEVGIPAPWQIYLYASADGLVWTLAHDGPLLDLQRHAGGMYGGPSFATIEGRLAPRDDHSRYQLFYHAASAAGNLPTDVYHASCAPRPRFNPCTSGTCFWRTPVALYSWSTRRPSTTLRPSCARRTRTMPAR